MISSLLPLRKPAANAGQPRQAGGPKLFPLPLLLAACFWLFANAASAAVVMDTGDSRIMLNRNSGDATGPDSRGVWSTPPRSAPDNTTPEELPFGIVPEVYVPWFQRQSDSRYPGRDGRPGWNPSRPGAWERDGKAGRPGAWEKDGKASRPGAWERDGKASRPPSVNRPSKEYSPSGVRNDVRDRSRSDARPR